MKKLSVLCVALCVGVSTTAAFARGGGMGSHHSAASSKPVTGGAFGTSPGAPGTNSLGTALSQMPLAMAPKRDRFSAPVPPSIARKRGSTR